MDSGLLEHVYFYRQFFFNLLSEQKSNILILTSLGQILALVKNMQNSKYDK